jgi:hypothetical protein
MFYLRKYSDWSRWPLACLLRIQVRIPPGAFLSIVSAVYCQVEVSATDWSLVQRSRIDSVLVHVCVYVWERDWMWSSWTVTVWHLQRVGIRGQAKTEISAAIIFKIPATGSFTDGIKLPRFLNIYTSIDYLSNCYILKQWYTWATVTSYSNSTCIPLTVRYWIIAAYKCYILNLSCPTYDRGPE